jgi:glucosamine-phosphate N-acetyltransferase
LLSLIVGRFDLIKKSGSYYITVIEDENKEIIASATLLVEHKFLHECGNIGHIEDVVVHDSQRGKRLGIR